MDSLMGKLTDISVSGGGGGTSSDASSSGPLSLLMNSDDPMMFIVGVLAAVVAIGGVVAASNGSSNGTKDGSTNKSKTLFVAPEPEPIDVSIPYDAAAVLCYQRLKPELSNKDYEQITSMSDFKTFVKDYRDITAQEIALKVVTNKFNDKKATFIDTYSSSSSADADASSD
jgi:hypothetical protein